MTGEKLKISVEPHPLTPSPVRRRGGKSKRGASPFRVSPHFVVTSVVHHEWLTMNGTRMNPS